MSTHYEDEAQLEQLRRWWSENWVALCVGLALGLSAIFGWQTWNNHHEAEYLAASGLFDELREDLAQNKTQDALAIGKRLVDEHAGSTYAAAAQFALAKTAVDANNYDEARGRLEWVVTKSSDGGFKALASLRLAQVLWQLGKPDEALAQLSVAANPAFKSLDDELRGDILMAKGDSAAARTAYQSALSGLPETAANREQLQHKLDSLAVSTAVSGAHS